MGGPWDTVYCEVKFKENGVHLNVEQISKPSVLASRLAAGASKAAVLTRDSLNRQLGGRAIAKSGAAPAAKGGGGVQNKSSHAPSAVSAVDARLAPDLSSFVFWPQKIRISPVRMTRFFFFTEAEHWTFDPPGFSVDWKTYNPAVGTFSTADIIDFGRTVCTTFYPAGPIGGSVKYDLRLITTAWNKGVPDGHAIIIIDPVLETSKL
jgi:hypothetical protein